MKLYGLIGYPLEHSASPDFFKKKFEKENIHDTDYQLFPLKEIAELPRLVAENPDLTGFNVTSPYKQAILPLLARTDIAASTIGAVNTVKVSHENGETLLHGDNTDYIGFAESLMEALSRTPRRALILGTGGAARAVRYALTGMHCDVTMVSRTIGKGDLTYGDLTAEIVSRHLLVVNATPLGMYPNTDRCPDFPYELLTSKHFLFDLIYNPKETEFLRRGRLRGAETCNGLSMLQHQAEASWNIWSSAPEFRWP